MISTAVQIGWPDLGSYTVAVRRAIATEGWRTRLTAGPTEEPIFAPTLDPPAPARPATGAAGPVPTVASSPDSTTVISPVPAAPVAGSMMVAASPTGRLITVCCWVVILSGAMSSMSSRMIWSVAFESGEDARVFCRPAAERMPDCPGFLVPAAGMMMVGSVPLSVFSAATSSRRNFIVPADRNARRSPRATRFCNSPSGMFNNSIASRASISSLFAMPFSLLSSSFARGSVPRSPSSSESICFSLRSARRWP